MAFLLMLMALTMKAVIPGGFMPGFDHGTFTAEICAEWSSASLTRQHAKTHHNNGEDGKEHTNNSHVCPYATLTMVAVSGADLTLIAQTLSFILTLGFIPVVAPILQRTAKLRPPLRGPPVIS